MKEMEINRIRMIIKKSIQRIKELQNEYNRLLLELEQERSKREKAIEEINKLENEIKERIWVGKEVEVNILGNKYSFLTDRDINEAIRIAMFVDEEAAKIKEDDPYSSENTIAILTALNIADKLFAVVSDLEELERYVE